MGKKGARLGTIQQREGARDYMEQTFICSALLRSSAENTAIARDNSGQMLQRRRELMDRCLHKDPFKLSNFCKSKHTVSASLMVKMTILQLKIFSQSSLLMISLSSQQLYMFSQSTLLMESLYITSLTSLQQNMASQPTLFMEEQKSVQEKIQLPGC